MHAERKAKVLEEQKRFEATQFVTEIPPCHEVLLQMAVKSPHTNGLDWSLSPAIGNLTHLTILNLMWNHLTGPIPSEIGKLSNLYILHLNGNKFYGRLPPELGYLSKLNRMQIDSNNISGPVPESFQYLQNIKHIHLNNNSISGSILKQLGQLPVLRHLLLENNNMSGELPTKLSNISSLVILSLRNCNLSGEIPDLSSIATLSYLDLSNNKLTGRLPSIATKSQYVTTIDLSFNELKGVLPENYFQFLHLQKLLLKNNSLYGDVPENTMIHNAFQYIKYSTLILKATLRLFGNPVCNEESTPSKYCIDSTGNDDSPRYVTTYARVHPSCDPNTCDAAINQEPVYGLIDQGICHCAYPLEIGYRLKSPSFSDLTPYKQGFYEWISSGLNLNLYQVHVAIQRYIWSL